MSVDVDATNQRDNRKEVVVWSWLNGLSVPHLTQFTWREKVGISKQLVIACNASVESEEPPGPPLFINVTVEGSRNHRKGLILVHKPLGSYYHTRC